MAGMKTRLLLVACAATVTLAACGGGEEPASTSGATGQEGENRKALLDFARCMRENGVEPGFYSFPNATCGKDMRSEEMQEKFRLGPVGTTNVIANGMPAMGPLLGMWFLYSVVVGIFAAYLASRTLEPGASYLAVFRVVGTASFLAYAFAHFSDGIWKQKPWSMTLKHVFDGLVYALVTAGCFGWLWP